MNMTLIINFIFFFPFSVDYNFNFEPALGVEHLKRRG